ncbi:MULTISPECIES: response regulator transcription factor [Legionella]|uniref:Bacterial regulatory protein, luxR family n=1 Tax=Legionella maceachernii TaxID=466 RepID=A0A0W0WFY4_9GAMM|nr:helix-turn-helix transcriptional regulator [Legionella maceachernii]KTD31257.1 Bacterial regulatory protein, luxR family [Legionella maceachernii]SKA30470.1 regulatory protein, luxR family [Legionella maceachernii]SUP01748.1 Bacterial regulatory proteins, luxR family [Legionella maceachernii]
MSEIEIKLKHHPIECNAEEITDLCRPLARLNITTFSHIRTYEDNHFALVCNKASFVGNYFKKNYHQADPCVQLKFEKSDLGQYVVWDFIDCRGKTAMMMKDAADFNFRHVFTILRQGIGFSEFYHFGTHLIAPEMNQFYVNNLDLLDRFILFFQNKVSQSKSLTKIYTPNQRFQSKISKSMEVKNWPSLNTQFNEQRQLFMNEVSQTRSKLTAREMEYAQLLLQGKTAKEIAAYLGQSYRTVESRVELLKSKLHATNKIDLVLKIKELV